MMLRVLLLTSLIYCTVIQCTAFQTVHPSQRQQFQRLVLLQEKSNDEIIMDKQRRKIWLKGASQVASISLIGAAIAVWTRPVWAKQESRTDGYTVQKSESDWQQQLSPMQYFILRQGGTEQPYFSILEGEKRTGVYKCAGCNTPLFNAKDKFKSGTGWPSFARGIGVQVQDVDFITANLGGAELRCQTCGGHLGDVFRDGFLFVGTEAFKTGKRYCIDGAALVFYPENGEAAISGDIKAEKDVE